MTLGNLTLIEENKEKNKMNIMEKELMQAMVEELKTQDSLEIVIVKGQIISLEEQRRKKDDALYLTMSIKIIKEQSEYNQKFNILHVVVPSDLCEQENIDLDKAMEEYYKNEVVMILSLDNQVKTVGQAGFKVNNANFYVQHIEVNRVLK